MNIAYKVDNVELEGVLIESPKPKAFLVLVPNWLGINEANLKQATEIAGRGYTVFVADMYGKNARPKDMKDAGAKTGALKSDRPLIRKRMQAALDVLKVQKGVDQTRLGAIGFCFGGTAALELARSGAALKWVVSFHGGLSAVEPAAAITAKVLALHGADDPSVPPEEVRAFEEEMRKAKADWQLVAFGGTVHSFTDVDANMPGKNQYNERSAKRAYRLMDELLAE